MREQLTESDVKKIQEEIDHRKLVVRKEAIEAVKEARAQGDLSENFEYYAAKKDKNRNESRIRYLENMLKHAKIVSEESRPDEVGMNDTVTLYFEDDDEEEVYRLVTSIRGNSLENRISIESPLGKAIRAAMWWRSGRSRKREKRIRIGFVVISCNTKENFDYYEI